MSESSSRIMALYDLDIGPTHEYESLGLEQREENTLKNVARGPWKWVLLEAHDLSRQGGVHRHRPSCSICNALSLHSESLCCAKTPRVDETMIWRFQLEASHSQYPHQHDQFVAAAKSLQSCPTLCDPIDGSPCPWDSPGKNTGVGCHFLPQCMKVKSESQVAQLCLTLSDPMDCSLSGSSVCGIFQARVLEWGAIISCYVHNIVTWYF